MTQEFGAVISIQASQALRNVQLPCCQNGTSNVTDGAFKKTIVDSLSRISRIKDPISGTELSLGYGGIMKLGVMKALTFIAALVGLIVNVSVQAAWRRKKAKIDQLRSEIDGLLQADGAHT